jgi:LysR family nitrogen assimilation transcriptional regulator
VEIRQIRYFVRIAEIGSMTKAADSLFIAQPALSIQMRHLEEEMGTQLFERHSRGVKLTEAGKTYFESAQRIIAEVERVKRLITKHIVPPAVPVTVAINPSTDPEIVARILTLAGQRCPEIAMSLVAGTSDQIVSWLRDGTVNMGLVYYIPPDCSDIQRDTLWQEQLMLFSCFEEAESSSSLQTTIAFEEALSLPLILQPRPHRLRQEIEAVAERVSVKVNTILEISSVSIVLDLVDRRFGATILPAGAASHLMTQGRVHARRIVEPQIDLHLSLAYTVDSARPNNELAIRQLIREVANERSGHPTSPSFVVV